MKSKTQVKYRTSKQDRDVQKRNSSGSGTGKQQRDSWGMSSFEALRVNYVEQN